MTARGVPLPSLEKRWSIGIYSGADPLALAPAAGCGNPVITARRVTDAPALFVADPFMMRDGPAWSMFFEVYRSDVGRGEIGLATSPDGLDWTYRHIVLREPFHLSYPYVFAWNSAYYMIPETHEAREVRLYRAASFPATWVFERTLLTGAAFTDASIVRHGGRWWLFTSFPGNAALSVFHADTLSGPWAPHAKNPVLRGAPERARSAGRIIVSDGRLLRVAQDNTASYGMRVHACEVTILTPSDYADRSVRPEPLLRGSGRGWNARGMHHVDAHEVAPGQWIACVDGFRKALMLGYRRWPAAPADAP